LTIVEFIALAFCTWIYWPILGFGLMP